VTFVALSVEPLFGRNTNIQFSFAIAVDFFSPVGSFPDYPEVANLF